MAEKTCWESFKGESAPAVDRLKQLVHEGNLRRVVVEHGGKTVAEFPVTAGVIGVLAAPVVAAIAAMVALLKDCTIHVEREPGHSTSAAGTAPGHTDA